MINSQRTIPATVLHPRLQLALTEADALARGLDGYLDSRQVIAAIIVAWRLANPNDYVAI